MFGRGSEVAKVLLNVRRFTPECRLDFSINTRTLLPMAQKTVVSLVDDLEGTEAAETVEMALDGVTYQIDLSDKNAQALRAIFAPYVAAARRTGGRRSPGRPRSSSASSSSTGVATRGREALKQIRDWAKSNGWTVSDRGRLPKNVIEAYDNRDK